MRLVVCVVAVFAVGC